MVARHHAWECFPSNKSYCMFHHKTGTIIHAKIYFWDVWVFWKSKNGILQKKINSSLASSVKQSTHIILQCLLMHNPNAFTTSQHIQYPISKLSCRCHLIRRAISHSSEYGLICAKMGKMSPTTRSIHSSGRKKQANSLVKEQLLRYH